VQAQVDSGQRVGPTSDELAEIKTLKSKVRDLEEANEILKHTSIIDVRELDPRHH
jgi:transposase